MDEDARIAGFRDARQHCIDHDGRIQAGGIGAVQAGDVETRTGLWAVAHFSSPRMTTGRSHWISTTQPFSVQTACSVPGGLNTTEPMP